MAKVARTAFAKKFGQKVEALVALIELYMEDSLLLSRFARKGYVFAAISVHFDEMFLAVTFFPESLPSLMTKTFSFQSFALW